MAAFVPIAEPILGERELAYVTDAVRSGWVSSIGPYIERFEKAFAEYVGVTHAVAVSNGTCALHLALRALGIGPGDEVLVPDLTFVAPVHAILQTGATPVFVDVEADTWCLDPIAVEKAISSRCRAIVAVHLYGHAAEMDPLLRVARDRGLVVIEDAAEAHGAEYHGRRCGSIGKLGVFSFYANKIMTTGEGGMVTSEDGALAHRLRYLRDHAMTRERRYYHTEIGFNYRMTNIQAALGLAQLEQIERFIEGRRTVHSWYAEVLADRPFLSLNVERQNTRNVYWMNCIVLTENCLGNRESIMADLSHNSIDSRPFFVPMHQLPHLSSYRTIGQRGAGCPNADRLGASGINLPSGSNLDKVTVDRIASVVLHACLGSEFAVSKSEGTSLNAV